MKKVYVCAPLGGNIEENLKKVKTYAIPCGSASIDHIQLALYLSISRRIL